jgi:hypothetical protein
MAIATPLDDLIFVQVRIPKIDFGFQCCLRCVLQANIMVTSHSSRDGVNGFGDIPDFFSGNINLNGPLTILPGENFVQRIFHTA